jgi:hypothetical protein
MRFQGLAVVLGRLRGPELIARERHKDFGFTTFVLIANPNDAPADLTLTYLPLTDRR